MKKVLVVCGATASGKTGFAVKMAKLLSGEVISADCMLVYKGLNIGTAKPTKEEMQGVRHHMIDVVPPAEKYSVGDYEAAALPILEKLVSEKKTAVICGGTGFYIQSLCFERGHGQAGADPAIREKYERIASEEGKEAVYERLEKIDPESARTLHPNDLKRVIRALEIWELTGKKKSEQRDGFVPRFSYTAVAFDYPRSELYDRINRRVDIMLEDGLVDEVRLLWESGINETCQCMQGIGYKEVLEYLKGVVSYSTMRDMIQQNTRNYAKRQITFFKKFPGIVWLDPHNAENEELVMEAMQDNE